MYFVTLCLCSRVTWHYTFTHSNIYWTEGSHSTAGIIQKVANFSLQVSASGTLTGIEINEYVNIYSLIHNYGVPAHFVVSTIVGRQSILWTVASMSHNSEAQHQYTKPSLICSPDGETSGLWHAQRDVGNCLVSFQR